MQPGDIIAGRFAVERLAGAGGMGTVFQALDRVTGERVALKVLQGGTAHHSDRFEREARILAELHHTKIVRYVAHGRTAEGKHWLAMEWLEGEDLEERLRRERLSVSQAVAIARCAAEALAEAHTRGIVHRDIKPSNLFLPHGDLECLKILDFGIAHVKLATRAMTRTGMTLGTPGYMAPEQARGDREVGPPADVFALGCVLFECLTGRPPFVAEHMMAVLAKVLLEEAPRVREIRADIPLELDRLVARMLTKDPKHRPSDARDLIRDLAGLDAAPPPERTSTRTQALSLTKGEQRLLSVVVARGVRSAPTTDGSANTMTPAEAERTELDLVGSIASFGPSVEWLADGSVIATLAGKGSATDQAAHAARCAIAMRALFPDVPMALATGRGNVAGRRPVGDVIDRAVRLLAIPSPHVRLDDVTAGLLDARFDVDGDAAGLALKGERELVEATRTLLGKPTPCVGRERELAMIDGIFAECVADPVARAVLVTAPAGLGKTRLASELLKKIERSDTNAACFIGRGDPVSAGAPFGLIAQALRRAAGLLGGEPLPVRQKKLRARVARHVPEAEQARVAEFLGELVGTPFSDEGRVQLGAARQDPMLLGDQMRRAWEDFLASECTAHPVVLVLEDLQWGDAPTVKFVDAALRKLHDQPFMVLALARPEVQQTFPGLWSGRPVTQMQLSELSKRASERLVRDVLGPDVTGPRVAMLVERAAGNAFYLEELIRAVADGKGDAFPETVLAMVQARLEALSPEARRVLRGASVYGQAFWGSGLGALLADKNADLVFLLSDLVDRELIERRGEGRFPGEQEYVFRHALVREAAYAMLTADDRALGHTLAGEWLETAGEQEAATLAEHFDKGGERDKAVRWYERAAEQALDANDMDAANARAERGIACAEESDGKARGRLRALQAEASLWAGDYARAGRTAEEAMGLLPRGSSRWHDAAAWAVSAMGPLGRKDRLVDIATELLAIGRERLDRSAIVALARATGQTVNIGEYALADKLIELSSSAEAGQLRSDPSIAGLIHHARAWRAMAAGDPGTALALGNDAVAAFEHAGNVRDASYERIGVAYAYMDLGAWNEAQEILVDVVAKAERLGLTRVHAVARHNLGVALGHLGRPEAADVERAAIDALASQGDLRLLGYSHMYLARILALQGDLAGAEREAHVALDTVKHVPPAMCLTQGLLAHVFLEEGRVADALEHATRASELLAELGTVEEGEALVRLTHARAVLAAKGDEAARELLLDARARLLARADKIADPRWRESFLACRPEHALTLALSQRWA
jgi:serine/threonine protein kinase/tetratricopeptide (TPR) repeat protein